MKLAMRTDRRQLRQRGVSLVELIMFIVIIGVAVVAVVRVLSIASVMSVDPIRQKQALAIAETLLEEVTLSRFTFCDGLDTQGENATSAMLGADGVGCSVNRLEGAGPEAGNVGRPFDNVNDYVDSYDTAKPDQFLSAGVLSDANGDAFSSGFAASITISAAQNFGGIVSGNLPATTEVLRISVTVTYDGDQSVTLDGVRTRHSPRSMP
jgi:MSHA pilin protein MshD